MGQAALIFDVVRDHLRAEEEDVSDLPVGTSCEDEVELVDREEIVPTIAAVAIVRLRLGPWMTTERISPPSRPSRVGIAIHRYVSDPQPTARTATAAIVTRIIASEYHGAHEPMAGGGFARLD